MTRELTILGDLVSEARLRKPSLVAKCPGGLMAFCTVREDELRWIRHRFPGARSPVEAGDDPIICQVATFPWTAEGASLLSLVKAASPAGQGENFVASVPLPDDRETAEARTVDLVWDAASDSRYPAALIIVADSGRVCIALTDYDHPLAHHVCIRTMRYALTADLIRGGGLYLHGAVAQTVSGRGVLLTGEKYAGKSSLLLGLLRTLRFHLVTNDKSVLLPGPDRSARPFVYGIPCSMPIWADTLLRFPEIKVVEDDTTRGWYSRSGCAHNSHEMMKKFFLHPAQVTEAFGCDLRDTTELQLVVELHFTAAAHAQPRLMAQDRPCLSRRVLFHSIDTSGRNDYWARLAGMRQESNDSRCDRFAQRTSGLSTYVLQYGPGQESEVARLLEEAS